MRTKVFEYKGYIGIESNLEVEGLLNDPMKKSQLGFVVDANFVDIQPEALELLKKIKKSNDCIGDVDVYKCPDGKIVFSWLGGPLKIIKPEDSEGSYLYDPNLLSSNSEVITSKEFKEFVDDII